MKISSCFLHCGLRAAVLLTALLSGAVASASDNESFSRVTIGAGIGTTGYGPVLTVSATKNLTLSAGYSILDFDADYDSDDANFTGTLDFKNIDVLLNWHPFSGNFHLSAGAMFTDSVVTLIGVPKPNNTFTIGGNEYTTEQVGTLTGVGTVMDGTVPYVGLGWAKAPGKSGFGAFFNLGVLFIDAPSVSLSANGTLSGEASFKESLRREEVDINDDLKDFELYPVVRFGITYSF